MLLQLFLLADWNFVENIQKPNVIVALIMAIVAFVIMVFTSKIVDKLFAQKTEEKRYSIGITIKMICVAICIIALVISLIW